MVFSVLHFLGGSFFVGSSPASSDFKETQVPLFTQSCDYFTTYLHTFKPSEILDLEHDLPFPSFAPCLPYFRLLELIFRQDDYHPHSEEPLPCAMLLLTSAYIYIMYSPRSISLVFNIVLLEQQVSNELLGPATALLSVFFYYHRHQFMLDNPAPAQVANIARMIGGIWAGVHLCKAGPPAASAKGL